MQIITVNRGSYSRGKAVAEKLAQKLGYECISRDILLDASEEFNIPEMKLVRALHDAPSVLERFKHGKECYISYIYSALLQYARKDNMVYHGLAGQFFLSNIPHVLKVRIIANMQDRVKEEMRRENSNFSSEARDPANEAVVPKAKPLSRWQSKDETPKSGWVAFACMSRWISRHTHWKHSSSTASSLAA